MMISRTNNPSRNRDFFISGKTGIIIVAVCLMIIVFAVVCAALMSESNEPEHEILRVMDHNAALKGVYVNGIDISGLNREEAFATTADLPNALLSERQFTIEVNGVSHRYAASELGMDTDYHDIMAQALSYGLSGTFEDRRQSAIIAKSEGVHFTVSILAAKDDVEASVLLLEDQMSQSPVDAGYVFMPNGYYEDGTAFDGKAKALEPMLIPEEERPNPLRYQYYRTKAFVKNYLPKDANISRFIYTEEVDGYYVKPDDLALKLIKALENDVSVISAVTEPIKPGVNIEDIKHDTRLVASWTSSYESSDGANRNYNIAKLSGMINGVVIEPGEVWSLNELAGPRTEARGWKDAAGINRGAIVYEPGGGVCQVSSTLYNAALRAGLEIVESSRHSIVSAYIPIGLDATISTNSPDLKLKNASDRPVFIVSYVNEKDKNVTVEVFGPSVVDEEHGEVILDFSSEIIGYTDMPSTVVHHKATQTPDGQPLKPGESRLYVKPRKGTKVQVYIHYLSLDGRELRVKKYYKTSYPAYTGQKYVNN